MTLLQNFWNGNMEMNYLIAYATKHKCHSCRFEEAPIGAVAWHTGVIACKLAHNLVVWRQDHQAMAPRVDTPDALKQWLRPNGEGWWDLFVQEEEE